MWDLAMAMPEAEFTFSNENAISSMPDLNLLLEGKHGPHRPYRQWFCVTYAWAIADPEALAFIAKHTAQNGIVEIGAGTGYWAWMLSQLGVGVIAYDKDPPAHRHNFWHNSANGVDRDESGHQDADGTERGEQYFPVRRGTHLMAARHPDRTLMLCWPPGGTPMAARALKRYRGEQLVFIGEFSDLTGDEEFRVLLENEWKLADSQPLMHWEGLHDHVFLFRRLVTDG